MLDFSKDTGNNYHMHKGVVPIALQKKALRQMLSAKSSPPKALQI